MATRTERLSRQDWVIKALDTMAQHGLGAIRVEPLARALGVTKGSFYWHFADHRALLDAMIETWTQNSGSRIQSTNEFDPDPRNRLHHMMHAVSDGGFGRFETAIRAWALHEPRVAEAVHTVDEDRLNLIIQMFRDMGFTEEESCARTRIVSQVLLGEHMVSRAPTEDARKRTIETTFQLVTARI